MGFLNHQHIAYSFQVLNDPTELPRQGFFNVLHRGASRHRHHHRVLVRGMRHGHLGEDHGGEGQVGKPPGTPNGGGGFGFIHFPRFFLHANPQKNMKVATNWWKTQKIITAFPKKNLAFNNCHEKKNTKLSQLPRILHQTWVFKQGIHRSSRHSPWQGIFFSSSWPVVIPHNTLSLFSCSVNISFCIFLNKKYQQVLNLRCY